MEGNPNPILIPDVLLNSGHKMPVIAMGTVTLPFPPPKVLVSTFLDAIEVGYRHFDTSPLYGSEEAVGRAVKAAVERGLIKGRHEMFITSKLWCTYGHPDLVLPALNNSLQRMGLDYIDLYLIHWPVRLRQETIGFAIGEGDVLPFDMRGVWGAMEECSRLGLARSIGVSNFSAGKLSQILQHASIPPAVKQVEMNVGWQQKALRAFCKEKGIKVSAWSPLGANGAPWGSIAVMESEILKGIAASKNKSLAQVALRWVYEQGVGVNIKRYNKERMRQNLQIFDWELSQQELDKIEQIPQRRVFTGEAFILKDGPIKSLEELWDGEA